MFIINFEEKFKGNYKLIKTARLISGVVTLIVWLSINKKLDLLVEKMTGPENIFYQLILGLPVYIGYFLFYWALFSWLVYYTLKASRRPDSK
jgi:hypothetical protein